MDNEKLTSYGDIIKCERKMQNIQKRKGYYRQALYSIIEYVTQKN